MFLFYILLFNSLIFEFKELILILKFSSFPSILTNKYIVTIAGNPKFATNCIKSTSNDVFLQKIFKIDYNALLIIQKGIIFLYKISSIHILKIVSCITLLQTEPPTTKVAGFLLHRILHITNMSY